MSQSEPFKDPDLLDELYNEKGMSQRDIAEELDCSQAVISKYMRKHGVDREKPNTEKPPNHRFVQRGETPFATYEQIQHHDGEKIRQFLIHRLIAVAIEKLKPSEFASSDKEVHHKSGHGLDNRHEKITVCTRSEHQELTVRDRLRRNDKGQWE